MNEVYWPGLISAVSGIAAAAGVRPLHDWLRRVDSGSATRLQAEMREVGMNTLLLPVYLLAWRGAALAVLLAGSLTLGLPIVAITLAAILMHAYPWWVRGRIRLHVQRVVLLVPGVARSLAGAIRVGMSLREAFLDVARNAPPPLSRHLNECAHQMQAGIAPQQALEALKQRVRIESVISLAAALQVAEQHGRVGDVIDRIGQSAEDTARLERKRLTDTASGRLMIRIMALYPIGFLAFLQTMHPDMLATFSGTLAGQVAMALVAALVYASIRWGSRILNR